MLAVLAEWVWLDPPNGNRVLITDSWTNDAYRLPEIQPADRLPDSGFSAEATTWVAAQNEFVKIAFDESGGVRSRRTYDARRLRPG
ncbi:hypothetical protein [Aquamicrobium soli]|jgi:hypothetical protein|uniref:Uncharacterized protein n=1 Tax=Aquamicrobium soli TaxID=1811518 RepID=A0ABV7K6Z4_9HYPH